MISHTTERFRQLLTHLPKETQRQAREAYTQFKREPFYAVRISRDYRALGILRDSEIIWFWIGSHSDYDKIMKQLRHA